MHETWSISSDKKAREANTSPTTKGLLKVGYVLYRVCLAAENVWPTESEALNQARVVFNTVCDDFGVSRRQLRYDRERIYSDFISDVLGQRKLQLCGEVKMKAQALVAKFYTLEGSSPEIAIGMEFDDEGCGRYGHHFHPIPLPMLALVAIVVQCALIDWEIGTFQPRRNKFEFDVYEPVYRTYLTSLKKWQSTNPACCVAR
ncbi:hypothetical protein EIP86_009722 [Pleurotus ostreatoroseus]|nr:hypothetical protein EIP86_009722 [Pleurotus ostreatoroseus]